MRLKNLFVKNFRSIDERGVRPDLAPPALLFGPNNVGKSAVVDALRLAGEIFHQDVADAGLAGRAGDALNLGGFPNYVRNRELDRDIVVALEVGLEGKVLPFSLHGPQVKTPAPAAKRPEEKRIVFKRLSDGMEVAPGDSGGGVARLTTLLILATLATGESILSVSRREAHIHPSWQTRLGGVFLTAASKVPPPLFILETHGEMLMLRILRRVRRVFSGMLPEGGPGAAPGDVAVYCLHANERGGVKVFQPRVTPDGDFDRNWPDSFFYERLEEVFR
jgi:predicted ATPase